MSDGTRDGGGGGDGLPAIKSQHFIWKEGKGFCLFFYLPPLLEKLLNLIQEKKRKSLAEYRFDNHRLEEKQQGDVDRSSIVVVMPPCLIIQYCLGKSLDPQHPTPHRIITTKYERRKATADSFSLSLSGLMDHIHMLLSPFFSFG